MNAVITRAVATLLLTLLLGACASQVPTLIRTEPAGAPSLSQVRADPATYLGRAVRFGGTIIATENRADITWLTVLAQPLYKDGEPQAIDNSPGRFLAQVPAFLDPQVYAPERQVTVSGTLAGTEVVQVGEYPYAYPVIEAQAWYLWPKPVRHAYPYDPWYDPWYYRPWYDPFYPYGPYPHRYWY